MTTALLRATTVSYTHLDVYKRQILAALTDPDTGGTGNVQSFDSPEDFEAALAAMKGG